MLPRIAKQDSAQPPPLQDSVLIEKKRSSLPFIDDRELKATESIANLDLPDRPEFESPRIS